MKFNPVWFAVMWLVNLVPGTILLDTQRDNWMSSLIPRNVMGRYLGQRLAIRSAFYLGAFCLLGFFLDSFEGRRLIGFAVIFTIAFIASFVDFLIFRSMRETRLDTEPVPSQPVKFGFLDYLGELKQKKLSGFILFTLFFGLTVHLCGPLYAVFMLDELHFSYLAFTFILAAEYMGRVISVPFWGR
jgi:hypothetical protein